MTAASFTGAPVKLALLGRSFGREARVSAEKYLLLTPAARR